MGSIEIVFKLLEKHVLSLVALVLIVFWLYPKMDDVWKLLIKLATPKEEPKKVSTSKKLEAAAIMDDKLMNVLRSVLTEFRASRAYIFSYHNGGENVMGQSFAKVSCTHEVVALGINPQMSWLQNMPKTLVHAFTRMIDSGLGVFCPCIEECFIETDVSTYQTLHQQGIKSCYCVGLYSEGRFPMGFLGIDFCTERVTLTESQYDKLKIMAERVATIFCLSGHKLCGFSKESILQSLPEKKI